MYYSAFYDDQVDDEVLLKLSEYNTQDTLAKYLELGFGEELAEYFDGDKELMAEHLDGYIQSESGRVRLKKEIAESFTLFGVKDEDKTNFSVIRRVIGSWKPSDFEYIFDMKTSQEFIGYLDTCCRILNGMNFDDFYQVVLEEGEDRPLGFGAVVDCGLSIISESLVLESIHQDRMNTGESGWVTLPINDKRTHNLIANISCCEKLLIGMTNFLHNSEEAGD